MPAIRPRLGVLIIVIGALLAIAVATTPQAPQAGHTTPEPPRAIGSAPR